MENEFTTRLNGEFHGVLRWEELDALWSSVRAEPEGCGMPASLAIPRQRHRLRPMP